MKEGWKIKKLGEICEVAPSKNRSKAKNIDPLSEVSFIPMEDLTIGDKYVYPSRRESYKNISSGYTYFEEGDILIAKVTPCFENGKLAIAKGLAHGIGFGSSEYIVIRNTAQEIISDYIYYYLRTEFFKRNGKKLMVGACGLKRLPKAYVASLLIPFPLSFQEQQRIVEILDAEFAKIDALKANAEKSLQAAKDLFQSALKQALEPKKNWECKTVAEISENLDYKRIPVTKKDREDGIYPYYGASGIVDYVKEYLFDEDLLLVSEDGANLIARSTPIAFSVSGKIWVNNHAHVLRFPTMDLQRFVEYFFANYDLSDYITGAAQPKLTQKALNSIIIEYPSDKEELAAIISRLDNLDERSKALQENYRKTIALCEDLKQALLRKAFNGEL